MPRDANGNYSLPEGTLANTGDTILVSQHNPAMQDIRDAVGNSLDRNGTGGMRAPLLMGGNPIQNLTPGTNPTDAATVGQVSGALFPPGSVIDFAGSAIPSGWLLCGGQSISRTTYAALFAVIGTTFGSVNGTSFSLPDCRGRATAGRDFDSGGVAARLSATTMAPNATTLGAVGGTQTHTLTEGQMPAHTHAVTGTTNTTGAHTHTAQGAAFSFTGAGGGANADVADVTTSSAGDHSHTVTGTAASTGGGAAHPIVQPTILFNKIIKV